MEKQRDSEEKGKGGGGTNEPCSARCPLLTTLYTNKLFFTLDFEDVPHSHFLGTDLN